MQIRKLIYLIIITAFISCSEDNDISVPRNLEEYVQVNADRESDSLIAFAATANASTSLSYIFYYPIEGATDIRYYEAESENVDANDFSKYRRKLLTQEDIFGGKLERFIRSSSEESWCIITYLTDGKFHKSNPIRLKNVTNSTEWTDEVLIEFPQMLEPKFTWTDGTYTDSNLYFQVISEQDDSFVSGTYTEEKTFQFYDLSNTIFNINEGEIPELLVDEEYTFTLMGIREDNWVNLMIQKSFVPRNLEEYINANSSSSIEEAIAFGASANENDNLSYIYYYPIEGATEIRYYETENTAVDQNDFTNYRRVFLSDQDVFGGKLKRFTRSSSEESWCIITYITDGKFHKSSPIHLKNRTQPTEWTEEVTIEYPQSLMPKFSWEDGIYLDNNIYFQVISKSDNSFLSGTFTNEKEFQFYNTSNVIADINTTYPEDLVLDDEYRFTMMGISIDNWVNLFIQKSFTVE